MYHSVVSCHILSHSPVALYSISPYHPAALSHSHLSLLFGPQQSQPCNSHQCYCDSGLSLGCHGNYFSADGWGSCGMMYSHCSNSQVDRLDVVEGVGDGDDARWRQRKCGHARGQLSADCEDQVWRTQVEYLCAIEKSLCRKISYTVVTVQ